MVHLRGRCRDGMIVVRVISRWFCFGTQEMLTQFCPLGDVKMQRLLVEMSKLMIYDDVKDGGGDDNDHDDNDDCSQSETLIG